MYENKKLKSLKELKKIVKEKCKNKRIIFTNGCFDILHPGHIRYLKEAKKFGDILIVALNSDKSVRRLKGKNRPVFSENDRVEILSSLEFVDYIIIFNELSPKKLILSLKPDIQVKGGDYKEEEVLEKETMEKIGGRVIIVPYYKGYSTTEIINKLRSC